MAKHIHIVGGGLAGLSAAVSLSKYPEARVIVYEGGATFGGRARSFYDPALDRRIDNGSHLILSGNQAVFKYLWQIDSLSSLTGPGMPLFPFVDIEKDKRWDLLLSSGQFPGWLWTLNQKIHGFRLAELRSVWRLMRARGNQTVAECLLDGVLADCLLKPFSISALNTSCEVGSAALLASVMRQSLLKGGKACIPYFPKEGMSETFVKPALSLIGLQGGELHTTSRISKINAAGNRIDSFVINGEIIELGPTDQLILALHPFVAEKILTSVCPEIKTPNKFESILNLHFVVDRGLQVEGTIGKAKFAGIVGGIGEWIFLKDGVISITISAANRFTGSSLKNLISLIWEEVQKVLNPLLHKPLSQELPPYRLLWEKRASFAATPEQNKRRPSCYTSFNNLFLAGEWLATGFPSTLEGAIASGMRAAQAVQAVL